MSTQLQIGGNAGIKRNDGDRYLVRMITHQGKTMMMIVLTMVITVTFVEMVLMTMVI